MVDYDEFEPIVVTIHDKGAKRGVAIYFGISEVEDLAAHGIDLRTDRRFLCRLTTDGKLILIPFSRLDFLEKREKGWQNMVDKKLVEDFTKLSRDDIDELRDDLIDVFLENEVEMTPQEKSAMLQFVKGHSGLSVVSEVFNIVNKVDPTVITKISTKMQGFQPQGIKPEPKIATIEPEPKLMSQAAPPRHFHLDSAPKNLMEQVKSLSSVIKSDLVDDLLALLSEDELENFDLTPREKMDILQLLKGHYDPAAMFDVLQVALRVLESKKWTPSAMSPRKMRDIKFGVELVPAGGLDKLIGFGKKFEMGGIDNIWITDHYNNQDPYVTLTLMAQATSVAQLGVGVTNPYIRHLASTASTIATLDQVSNNRMVLGLGAGDKSTLAALHIETGSALKTVLETVKAIRMLWAGKNVNFTGDVIKLENARLNFTPERNIPIYIGAQGPKMLKLAGEIGDGILINGSHELDFEIARKNILEGVKQSNRSINETDVVAYTCFSTSDDRNAAIKATVPVVTFIAAATPPKVLERHDLNVQKASQMKDYLSKGDMASAFKLVDDKFIEAFSISGNPEYCLDKIESLKKAGVTQFVFGSPLGPKKKQAVDLITDRILASYS